MKKLFILSGLLLILISCSSTDSIARKNSSDSDEDETVTTRRITEQVVVVKSNSKETILATGRYGDWYRINNRLTERMYYNVTLEVPRQKSKNFIVDAGLNDFTPGDFLQKDLMAKYDMAYSQIRTGTQ